MVGVVGSSRIAPTNIFFEIKHLALGAFFLLLKYCKSIAFDGGASSLHVNQ
jgi:hypothetical protein